ncbi:MAG: RidA family protein [Anaerolineales bacterium]|nr:RidA family protein [Anaerolineales bacterium]
MNHRINISSGLKWEETIGYSRAVKISNIVEVSGTTAFDENGNIVGADDPYQQTKFIIAKIEKALLSAGATLNDIVRTRMFITDINRWEEVGRAHGEYFHEIKPAATMVQIQSLIDPQMLVEIEATAILQNSK